MSGNGIDGATTVRACINFDDRNQLVSIRFARSPHRLRTIPVDTGIDAIVHDDQPTRLIQLQIAPEELDDSGRHDLTWLGPTIGQAARRAILDEPAGGAIEIPAAEMATIDATVADAIEFEDWFAARIDAAFATIRHQRTAQPSACDAGP